MLISIQAGLKTDLTTLVSDSIYENITVCLSL